MSDGGSQARWSSAVLQTTAHRCIRVKEKRSGMRPKCCVVLTALLERRPVRNGSENKALSGFV